MRTPRMLDVLSVLTLLTAFVVFPATAQTLYEAKMLGLEGGGAMQAYALNNYAQVVGRLQSITEDADGTKIITHALVWQNGEALDLSVELRWGKRILQLAYAVAFNLSDTHHVVGAVQCSDGLPVDQVDTDVRGGVYVHAFVYRPAVMSDLSSPYPGEAFTDLGVLPPPAPGGERSAATGISPNGLYVVGWSDYDRNNRIHAFLVTPTGGVWTVPDEIVCDGTNALMTDLGTLNTLDATSSATAVNNFGQVVGWSYTAYGSPTQKDGYAAFLIENPNDTNADGRPDQWFVAGPNGANALMTDLGTLGGHNSWARALNDACQIVGESDTGTFQTHAFVWNPNPPRMTDLGTLGGNNSAAAAINEIDPNRVPDARFRGAVVGWALNAAGAKRAFVVFPRDLNADGYPDQWYADANGDGLNDLMFDLNDWLPSGFKVRLTEARDINGGGQITGFGQIGADENGQQMAYLLTPTTATAGGTPRIVTTRQDVVLAPVDAQPGQADQPSQTPSEPSGTTAQTYGPLHFLCGVGFTNLLPLVLTGLLGLKLRARAARTR